MTRYVPSIGLGITQIIGYGTLLYAYAVLLPKMAQDLGLSLSTVFGLLSVGLLVAGFVAPLSGVIVDRYGGRWVMTFGSVVAGVALMALSLVQGWVDLLIAIVVAQTASMFVLYNVAFAAVAQIETGVPTARAISIITLFGGLASTIFWPFTLMLSTHLDWAGTWVVLGAMVLLVCVPIHFVVLKGPPHSVHQAHGGADTPSWVPLQGAARRRGMFWMIVSFTFSGYLMGALMTLWVTNVQDLGHTAAMAAFAGALIGPFKTIGRGFEMLVGRNLHPLHTYLLATSLQCVGFVILLSIGISVVGLVVAAAIYGMGDGIKTIARGTLPLALFGTKGYGARLGWIAFVLTSVNASAPFTFAWLTQTYNGWTSFAVMAACLVCALLTYFFIPNPRRPL